MMDRKAIRAMKNVILHFGENFFEQWHVAQACALRGGAEHAAAGQLLRSG